MGFDPDIERTLGTMPAADAAAARKLLAEAVERNGRMAALDHRVAGIARRHAESTAAVGASLDQAKGARLLRGMKPTVAVIGAVAVGAVVIGATKFMRRHRDHAEQSSWRGRIAHERAVATQHSQRQL